MGAFGGFAGGLGGGLLKQEAANDPTNPGGNTPSSGASATGGGNMGILPIIKNVLSGGKSGAAAQAAPTATPMAQTGAPVVGGIPPPPGAGQTAPVNTQQQQQPGFHGLAPMLQGYIQNHQAKVQDAAAGPHVQALQDPNTTPEQRQYHISQLQATYANRPDVLQKMGIGGQSIPNVSQAPQAVAAPAAPAAAAPSLNSASASDLGGK